MQMSNKSKMAPTVGGKPIQKIGNCKAHKKMGTFLISNGYICCIFGQSNVIKYDFFF